MLSTLAKSALVVMAGIYAVRATDWMVGEPFDPLFLLAAAVFCLTLVLFYRMPRRAGGWLYSVVALCLVGMCVNGLLLFVPDPVHNNQTNATFSAVCIAGWAGVALYNLELLRKGRAVSPEAI